MNPSPTRQSHSFSRPFSGNGSSTFSQSRRWLGGVILVFGIGSSVVCHAGPEGSGTDSISGIESIWRRSTADHPANQTVDFSLEFTPERVDLGNNRISLQGTHIERVNAYSATYFYFRSTGTLPAPLKDGTPYLLVEDAKGLKIFPVLGHDDWALAPGHVEGEWVAPAVAWGMDVNPVVLADAGTGTHTVYAPPLITRLVDQGPSGNDVVPRSKTNLNEFLETGRDGRGAYYISRGPTGRQPTYSVAQPLYGKLFSGTVIGDPLTSEQVGKRFMYSIIAMEPIIALPQISMIAYGYGDRVDLAKDQVLSGTHCLRTGRPVVIGAVGDAVLPEGMPSTAFVRAVSGHRLSLHPTEADAKADTNRIALKAKGDGLFYLRDTLDVTSGLTAQFIHEVNWFRDGNDHYYAPGFLAVYDEVSMGKNQYFLTGKYNGQLNFVLTNRRLGPAAVNGEVFRVKFWHTDGSTAPTREDTGKPLARGRYWMNRVGMSDRRRLYDTEEAARADVGVEDSGSAIRFSALGKGRCMFILTDKARFMPFGQRTVLPTVKEFPKLVDVNEFGIYVTLYDQADPDSRLVRLSLGKDGIDNLLDHQEIPEKGRLQYGGTPPAIPGARYHLFNTNEPHVPGGAKVYEEIMGFSDTDPREDIRKIMDYLQRKYAVKKKGDGK